MDHLEYLMESCKDALRDISDDDRTHLTELILSGKRIFIFGVGRSGLVGQTFAIRLVQLGLPVFFVGDMTTPIISKDDLLLLISNTGNTMSVVKTAQIAGRIGTHVACITSDEHSHLAKYSDTIFKIYSQKTQDSTNLAPLGTIFEDATLLFFDTLIPELMLKLDKSEQDMRNNHAIWV